MESFFISDFRKLSDRYFKSNYYAITSNRFIANLNGINANLILLFTFLIAVYSKNIVAHTSSTVALVFILSSANTLSWVIRSSSDVENGMNSVERYFQLKSVSQEGEVREKSSGRENGEIVFKNVTMRYREGLDFVLKNITFRVEKGEKIGIVGRTGAGKSSLITALMRLADIEYGNIFVNGMNINEEPIHLIRSQTFVIPQDPVIFSGSLRFNLDPYYNVTDDEIWLTLNSVQLSEYVSLLPQGIYTDMSSESSMSTGQKQLLCFGRALLNKSNILVLDEATAGIDLETEELIRQTLKDKFNRIYLKLIQDCTILTIAHRLNTVIDSDKILVLHEGRLIEFDTPSNLIESKGEFYSMLHAS